MELDGIFDIHNLQEDWSQGVDLYGEEVIPFSAMVKGKSLKRKIKVVVAELRCGDMVIRKILFSTDLRIRPLRSFSSTTQDSGSISFIGMPNRTQVLDIGNPLTPTGSPSVTTHPCPPSVWP